MSAFRSVLAPDQMPTAWYNLAADLPRLGTGKINHRELEKLV